MTINDQKQNSNITVCYGELVDRYLAARQQKYQRDGVFSLDSTYCSVIISTAIEMNLIASLILLKCGVRDPWLSPIRHIHMVLISYYDDGSCITWWYLSLL